MVFLRSIVKKKKTDNRQADSQDQKQNNTIDRVFRPGTKVDVIFYSESSTQPVRSAFIHDCNYDSKQIIISQTSPITSPSIRFQKMGLTRLSSFGSKEKLRLGVSCRKLRFIKDYQVSDRIKESAIIIDYNLPLEQYNIRGSYRIEPQIDCEIKGKIFVDDELFFSNKDFRIQNISTGGVGLLARIPDKKTRTSLSRMDMNEAFKTHLSLINFNSMEYDQALSVQAKIVWKNSSSKDFVTLGAKFIKKGVKEESVLQQFVHKGQLYNIRKNQTFFSDQSPH